MQRGAPSPSPGWRLGPPGIVHNRCLCIDKYAVLVSVGELTHLVFIANTKGNESMNLNELNAVALVNPTAAHRNATNNMRIRKATLIQLEARAGADQNLKDFLVQGRDIVADTEPGTLQWYALSVHGRPNFAIFDTFADNAGRQAHFSGHVAAALAQEADAVVKGGWEQGVLSNVTHYDVVAATQPRDGTATVAGYIPFTAAPGKADELAAFLTVGRDIVADTEPGTLFWLALRCEERPNEFAIVDFFTNPKAVDAHFAGQVAAALKSRAADLIEGGWDAVLANVAQFEVNAAK